MAESKNVALVFGASGISGWAVTNCALSYPTPTTFNRVIGLTNKPLPLEKSGLPGDARLELHSGVNLRGALDEVVARLQEKVPNLEAVTHVYYLAYSNATAWSMDVMAIRDINVKMTYNAVHAVDKLCKNLKFFVLQTGTNVFTVQITLSVSVFRFQEHIEISPPLREDNPRIPSPWGDEIFYYAQVDLVKEANKGKSWKWCEVRPDQIVGHVPIPTSMTYVEPLALYLMLYRYVNGPGATPVYPGSYANYIHSHTPSSQDIIARSELYLSLEKPDQAHGEAFNTADNAAPAPFSIVWPKMCEYFGLTAQAPTPEVKGWTDTDKWWIAHQDDYKQMCEEYDLHPREIPAATWIFLAAGMSFLARDRDLSLEKIRSVGFTEEYPVAYGYFRVFDRLAQEKIILSKAAWSK
ncbi:hypothetical protein ASPACDRAFT_1908734 [Aspergillus aculeatus ATCC 16872]|uniref:PRISE-like Rossmann-fold domain-containing protein n=1 Tax=Aspergillus aculeatus (strain ATCC 16872 / CBS 172.66 / WB 5094) TaxID=690307 RepID=A0A1L9WFA3_ASPA1|nr:uncharacterized protein ASPACDRAFT_1908734 [Aspergillus aculeatus ATCC 16872]OJJ94785.1 hypothetical protein ASPACDRAFT_1908734 [Aspergillus aculeatus ATCC 16872]